MSVTVISISHLFSLPSIPNVKCIAWNFDGFNFVSRKEDLKGLRFENGDIIPDVESYFFINHKLEYSIPLSIYHL
jgi:hypothetical protein